MFERYSFVAITTLDLYSARRFWVDALGCPVTEEKAGHFFIVDVGGLRLCVDLADDEIHKVGGSDPVIGLKVQSVAETLRLLAAQGIQSESTSDTGGRGNYATIRDPDGRAIIITESDRGSSCEVAAQQACSGLTMSGLHCQVAWASR